MNPRAYLTQQRVVFTLAWLGLALTLAALAATAIGAESISPADFLAALRQWLTANASPSENEVILFSYRLPRVALAVAVGAALALAGAAFQSLLRNPLADPHILGVSSGAAFGAILGILCTAYSPLAPNLTRTFFSFAGAIITSALVYALGRQADDPARLVLAGVILSTFLSSLNVLMLSLVDDVRLRNITLWLLGDLSNATTEGLLMIVMALVIGFVLLLSQARALNLMMIGERDAFALGVATARTRWLVFAAASLLTGTAVAAGGAIGYVGLLTPHLIRLVAGADNRLVLPASALGGALLALIADTLARTVFAPQELPTGAFTALLGAPLFIYLLLKHR
jgi:iron complex transport system permease protein